MDGGQKKKEWREMRTGRQRLSAERMLFGSIDLNRNSFLSLSFTKACYTYFSLFYPGSFYYWGQR